MAHQGTELLHSNREVQEMIVQKQKMKQIEDEELPIKVSKLSDYFGIFVV